MRKPPIAAAAVTQKPDLGAASLMVKKTFVDARISDRDQLGRGEALQIGIQTETADADHRRDRPEEIEGEQGKRIAVLILQRGQDVVAKIEEDHEWDPDRD